LSPTHIYTLSLHDALPISTSATGGYAFDRVSPGRYQLSFTLLNFASLARHDVNVDAQPVRVDVVLRLSLSADVTVTGKRTFTRQDRKSTRLNSSHLVISYA